MHPENNQSGAVHLYFQTLPKEGPQGEATWSQKFDFLAYGPEFFPPGQAPTTWGRFATVGSRWFRWLSFKVSFLVSGHISELEWVICLGVLCSVPLSVVPLCTPAFYELL